MRNSGRISGQISCTGAIVALLLGGGAAPALAGGCTKAITISETNQMSFGTIGSTSAGGTVTLSSSGGVTGTGGFLLTGAPAAGSFAVDADKSCAVVITFGAGSLVGPGASMTINNFTNNAGAVPTTDGKGKLNFSVGAQLQVNASQRGGSYNGTYTVTVTY